MDNKSPKPYREISQREKLQRYETILDYFLEKRINKETQDIEIKVSDALTKSCKNIAHLSDVIHDVKGLIHSLNNPKDKNVKRIFAKSYFLGKVIENETSHVLPFNYISSYSHLLNILEQENEKC